MWCKWAILQWQKCKLGDKIWIVKVLSGSYLDIHVYKSWPKTTNPTSTLKAYPQPSITLHILHFTWYTLPSKPTTNFASGNFGTQVSWKHKFISKAFILVIDECLFHSSNVWIKKIKWNLHVFNIRNFYQNYRWMFYFITTPPPPHDMMLLTTMWRGV
jgi:hypothetical protein